MHGNLSQDHDDRLAAALRSLEGLSVGDAFGERFFGQPEQVMIMLKARAVPAPPWKFTDDTVMAISIVDVLAESQKLDPDRLAELFGRRYRHDRMRGYGGTAHEILGNICSGLHWQDAASQAFDGTGSMGNGGAMRAPVVGAYFGIQQRLAFDQAQRGLNDFKTLNGDYPRTHEQYWKEVIEANLISLPELPEGEEYYYDYEAAKSTRGEEALFVVKPKP